MLTEPIIVKKKVVTSENVLLKDIHPNKKILKDRGEKHSDKTEKATVLGIKWKYKDYDNNNKEIGDVILVIPLDTIPSDYDNKIDEATKMFERDNQSDRWSELIEQYGTENIEMIYMEEAYE